MSKALRAAADLRQLQARWERARTGIVLTAHPTFGLSDALSKRIVEFAVADDVDPNTRIGVPHRPDENIDARTTSTGARRTLSATCATPMSSS